MIITDTGFWLALSNPQDTWHERSVISLQRIKTPLITTVPVLTETCALLSSRLSAFSSLQFIRGVVDGKCIVFHLDDTHIKRCSILMAKYQDLPMDIADASLVVLAEELNDGTILSTDQRDFKTYRWKNRKPFRNLLAID